MSVPQQAHAVVGGGVSVCSMAHHVAGVGRDVVRMERRGLTSGSTRHAAGPVGRPRRSRNLLRLARGSAAL